MSNKGRYATPNGFLRMCIDCKHSKVYQASNSRNIWYFCTKHGVPTHYNESCENYEPEKEDSKETYPLSEFGDFPRFPQSPSSPFYRE